LEDFIIGGEMKRKKLIAQLLAVGQAVIFTRRSSSSLKIPYRQWRMGQLTSTNLSKATYSSIELYRKN
jgi:hypothetical protein